MADAADSKSAAGDSVRVQVPPSAVDGARQDSDCSVFASFYMTNKKCPFYGALFIPNVLDYNNFRT